jgi:hypothetical protein
MKSRILRCVIAMTLLVAMAVPVRLAAQSKYRVVRRTRRNGRQRQRHQ